jgi:hypothetical protein
LDWKLKPLLLSTLLTDVAAAGTQADPHLSYFKVVGVHVPALSFTQ